MRRLHDCRRNARRNRLLSAPEQESPGAGWRRVCRAFAATPSALDLRACASTPAIAFASRSLPRRQLARIAAISSSPRISLILRSVPGSPCRHPWLRAARPCPAVSGLPTRGRGVGAAARFSTTRCGTTGAFSSGMTARARRRRRGARLRARGRRCVLVLVLAAGPGRISDRRKCARVVVSYN